jgi:deazaflavin-dependent oxidoreductase (nitroreductase family)
MTISPRMDYNLKQGFRYLNRFMVMMWRLGLGQFVNFWPEGVGRIMVITTTGRKSGLKRRTPVNYAVQDGEIYCVAGFGPGSDWYRNLRSNPKVEIWMPDSWWMGEMEEVADPALRLPLIRKILVNSGFAGRLAGINPNSISDAALDKVTAPYVLLHVHRTEARTGRGGPGELAWIWPAATFLLLMSINARRKNKKR